MRMISFDPS